MPTRTFNGADLHAFVDGQMDLERRTAFMLVLAANPELKAKVDSWRQQNSVVTAAFGAALSEPVPLRLTPANLKRVAREAPADGPEFPAAGSSNRAPWIAAAVVGTLAFAAGGAAVLGATALGLLTPPNAQVRPVVAALGSQRSLPVRALEAHQTYVTDLNHAVEVGGTDEARLLKWLQHRLSLPVRIPDLHREGWTLLGGRVIPGELGPAAFLIYNNGVDRLGLYIARTNTRGGEGTAVYDNGTGLATVGYWVDEPVGYAITTSRDSSWLSREGEALIGSIRTQSKDNASAL